MNQKLTDNKRYPNEVSSKPVLTARALTKTYGRVEALRGADLDIYSCRIHALVGDNGAGKSTLLKILAGAQPYTGGELRVDGHPVNLSSPVDARQYGIETVYQDLALAGDRSCSANVFLGREIVRKGLLGRMGILDRKAMDRVTRQAFVDLSVPITDVRRPVSYFSGGQRQGVAIARGAIWAEKVVLLDEPTAALGVRQRGAVDELLCRLRDRGLAVVLVTHDMPTVLQLADTVTVLRLGQTVATRHVHEIDLTWIVSTMVGHGVSTQEKE